MLYIMGIVFLAVGVILRVFPPRRMNLVYEYRTNLSMRNKEIWDEAQRYSANSFIVLGILYEAAAFTLAELVGEVREGWQIAVFLTGVIGMIIFDELHLRKVLKNEDGNNIGL